MVWCYSVTSLGTKLDNESLRIALGLHPGVPIVVEHTCVCGSKVDFLVLTVCLAGVVEAVFLSMLQ